MELNDVFIPTEIISEIFQKIKEECCSKKIRSLRRVCKFFNYLWATSFTYEPFCYSIFYDEDKHEGNCNHYGYFKRVVIDPTNS